GVLHRLRILARAAAAQRADQTRQYQRRCFFHRFTCLWGGRFRGATALHYNHPSPNKEGRRPHCAAALRKGFRDGSGLKNQSVRRVKVKSSKSPLRVSTLVFLKVCAGVEPCWMASEVMMWARTPKGTLSLSVSIFLIETVPSVQATTLEFLKKSV